MTAFEALKPQMDAQVDNHLGDSIIYKINGDSIGDPLVNDGKVPAFVIDYVDDGSMMESPRPGTVKFQLKIRKSLFPAAPDDRPRLQHSVESAKLDGIYRPMANVPVDGGDYWIADLQKAPG